MRLSFDDPESFKEVAGSLRFNNPLSDPNTSGMPPPLGSQGHESEDTWKFEANYCTITMCTVTMILPNWLQLEYNEQTEAGEGREAGDPTPT